MASIAGLRRRTNAAALALDPRLLLLRKRGVILSTFHELSAPWFRALKIATVLDVGANTGQFAITVKSAMPTATVYSFEPIQECFDQLEQRMSGIEGFHALNLALGDQGGRATFEQNRFTPSSSFLTLARTHKSAFPFAADTLPTTVNVVRLDDVTQDLTLVEPILIKIDVQGYEDRVLRGGEQTIKRARLMIVENSYETLYEGQPLFDSVYRTITDWGFKYIGSLDHLRNPMDGRPLQEDSMFLRNNA